MARLNKKTVPVYTHEGIKASHIGPLEQLKRAVLSCMLWEDTFYEDGVSIAERIKGTIPLCKAGDVFNLAVEARTRYKLRHVPLLIAREMARNKNMRAMVGDLLPEIIRRPDELSEFLAIYWDQEGKQPLANQVKKGLAKAFGKFGEYQLAKYNRKNKIKLSDVLCLVHPKPKDKEQEALWKRLLEDRLKTPDTWESNLAGGKNKRETFERLIAENKLGGMALLRNLRGMREAGVPNETIKQALTSMNAGMILPFRFISAAKYAPVFEPEIETAMLKSLSVHEKLPGKTALLIDGSGSMFGTKISARSEIDRFEAACALAILAREICDDVVIAVFSYNAYIVPPRRGFSLRDSLYDKAEKGGTYTQRGIDMLAKEGYDRIIIFTDEQSHQSINNPIPSKAYIINIAPYKYGIGYGNWIHINGFSEAVIDFIIEYEQVFGS